MDYDNVLLHNMATTLELLHKMSEGKGLIAGDLHRKGKKPAGRPINVMEAPCCLKTRTSSWIAGMDTPYVGPDIHRLRMAKSCSFHLQQRLQHALQLSSMDVCPHKKSGLLQVRCFLTVLYRPEDIQHAAQMYIAKTRIQSEVRTWTTSS